MLRKALVAAAVLVVATAAPVAADPDNDNTLTRTLVCDDGSTVTTVFAGESGSNFNATDGQSVFVYKRLVVDRLPYGPSDNDTDDVRGLQGLDGQDLVTCGYVTPSDNRVTVIGFFTPRA